MLELRPGCECCDRDLPPDSDQARVCSFECTFCRPCVTDTLQNVCPNCGYHNGRLAIQLKPAATDDAAGR